MVTIEIKKSGEGVFTDRSNQISWDSISVRQALTKEVDSANFTVARPQTDVKGQKTYKPDAEDEVMIKQDGTKVFAGFIVRVTERITQGTVLVYECEARDYTHLLDRKLVNKTYVSQTIAQIISDIITNFSAGGITTVNVSGATVVDSITFNNLEPSRCIQKLADTYNRDWYIDFDKDLHFFSKNSAAAPFGLSDTNGKYIFDSLEIIRDTTQIRNSILIEGGEEKTTATFTEKFVGDAKQHTFPLAYKYTDVSLTVGGVAKTVGIDGIDDFTTKDSLFNYQMKTLRFDPAVPPGVGVEIAFTGKYYFPIAAKVRESNSITKYGERQTRIVETKITDRDVARERAKADIYAYADKLLEGTFITYESGLRTGQVINIQSDIRAMNEDYLIKGLEGRMLTPDKLEWRASLVSVKTYEIIDLLAKVFDNQNMSLDPNSVVNTAEMVLRSIKISRLIVKVTPNSVLKIKLVGRLTNNYLNSPPIWVAGQYAPTNFATDRKRPAFADRSCILAS